MKNGFPDEKVQIEPNSKPYLLKRIISDGFDVIVIFLLFMILSAVIFSSPLAKIYNEHFENYKKVQDDVIEEFGKDNTAAINESLNGNDYYKDELFAANLHGYILKLVAGFVAEAAVLLIVPLLSKARGTPGKLLTRIMPFCERKRARASRLSILGRFAFIFIIDSAFLYLFTGIFTFMLVPVIRLIEMLLNKKNRTICDTVSGITVIEQLSYDGIDSF